MKLTNSINKLHKVDISSLDQIQILVNSFYEKVRKDDELGPIFEKHIQDWKAHLHRMYQFWERLLFGKETYQGNPFEKHLPLPIEKQHFGIWVQLFTDTVNEHFAGPSAEKSKQLARNIAGTFQFRMGIDPGNATHAIPNYSRP